MLRSIVVVNGGLPAMDSQTEKAQSFQKLWGASFETAPTAGGSISRAAARFRRKPEIWGGAQKRAAGEQLLSLCSLFFTFCFSIFYSLFLIFKFFFQKLSIAREATYLQP